MNFRNIYNHLKKWIFCLSPWQKIILSTLVSSISGSSLVACFNIFALYYYAINKEIRIPFEGVEFMALVMGLLTFSVLLIITLGYLILSWLVEGFVKSFSSHDEFSNLVKILYRKSALYRIAFIFSMYGAIFLKNYLGALFLPLPDFLLTINALAIQSTIETLIITGSFITNYDKRKKFVFLLVSISVCTIFLLLLNQTVYGKFLALAKYGGEVPVQIEYSKMGNRDGLISGLLLLKTRKNVIVKNISSDTISEIPIDRISKIEYKNKGATN